MPGKDTLGYNSNITSQDKADNAKSELSNVMDIGSRDRMSYGDMAKGFHYSDDSRKGVGLDPNDGAHLVTHRPPTIGPADYGSPDE